MTRIKISAGIITALSIIAVVSCILVNSSCNSLIKNISVLQELYISGDDKKADIKAEQLEKEWASFRKKASVLIRSEQLRDTERLFSGIKYLSSEDLNEALSHTDEIICSLEILKNGEIPILTNIL